MSRTLLTEAQASVTATPVTGQPGRFLLQLIDPGWGASGHYAPDVLEAAAAARVFPAGLHMYLDHPRADGSGVDDNGNRSVLDLAAVLAEDARMSDGALVAEAVVFGPHREALTQMAESIGLSIRAYAETENGEADGRRGTIVRSLVEALSCDFVTRAGRGGRILQVIESAGQVVDRAVAHGVAEATANDTREALHTALRDAYGGEDSWVWVRDFDDSTVWYEHETPDGCGTYAEGYTLSDDGAATLAGSRTEVRVRTEYVPAARPDGTITEESEEDTMPTIEESELTRLREADGRVQTLESELSTERTAREAAETRATTAETALAESTRTATIARIVDEAADAAHVDLNEFEAAGLASRAVVNDGTVDEAATRTAFDTAIAAIKESRGSVIHGFGRTKQPTPETVSESDLDALDDAVFGKIQEA